MDWEKKFSTIVHETEANLDRVRRRLQAAKEHTQFDVPVYHSTVLNLKKESSGAGEAPPLFTTNVGAKMADNSPITPPVWAVVLEEKFNKQQKTIETLLETIVSLQTEKELQKTTIEQLSDRVASLHERVEEKGVDLDTERRIQQWKLETSNEMIALKQQVQLHNKQDGAVSQQSNQVIEQLRAQIRDATHECRDETESARKDVDYYKMRMMRLEKNISGLGEELGELTRRHNELNSDVISLTDRYRSDYKELSSDLRDKLTDIEITRNELSTLKADVTVPNEMNARRRSPVITPQIRIDKGIGGEENAMFQKPTQWRELLSHSLSTISVESSDSTLSSGYLARRKSQDSNMEPPDEILAGSVNVHISSSSDEDINDDLSTPSSSPSSLSINDL